MNQLVDHFSLGLPSNALMIIRMLMVPLLIYNLSWSIKGFWQLIRGIPYPTSVYQSATFLSTLGVLALHNLAFAGRPFQNWSLPYLLMIHCAFFASAAASAYGRRISIVNQFEKFYWLFNKGNLDLAARVSVLAEQNLEFTTRAIETAETALSLEFISKVNARGTS